jgi:hypothetical protein
VKQHFLDLLGLMCLWLIYFEFDCLLVFIFPFEYPLIGNEEGIDPRNVHAYINGMDIITCRTIVFCS